MNKLFIGVAVFVLIGAYVGVRKVIETWGVEAIVVGAFAVMTLYGISRLYSYGVEHPHG